VKIGCREINGRIEGHAWVESAGRILFDDPHVREHYPAQFQSKQRTYFSRDT
jgi:sensor domain CHASE-containing protein